MIVVLGTFVLGLGMAGALLVPSSAAVGGPHSGAGPSLAPALIQPPPGGGGAPDYQVSFVETGLPAGSNWSVDLAGWTIAAWDSPTFQYVNFSEPNGSYAFTVQGVPGYAPIPESGTITVNGAAVSQPIVFLPVEYDVTFVESGLPTGTTWSVTLNGTTVVSATNTVAFNVPDGTYAYRVNPMAEHYYLITSSGNVTVLGSGATVNVAFYSSIYTITLTESNLPAGTGWSATLTGPGVSEFNWTSTKSLGFTVPNGTYTFTIGVVSGWTASPHSGSIVVSGSSVIESIVFTRVTYTVTFSCSGLLPGETFSVTLDGAKKSAACTNGIQFTKPNGSYPFKVGSIKYFVAAPANGTVVIAGTPVTVGIQFRLGSMFPVTFNATGLAPGVNWSVTFNGTSRTLGTFNTTFWAQNGTYSFNASGWPGYNVTPSSGVITVNGKPVWQNLRFSESVTFSEIGLPLGTVWNVTLNGTMRSSGTPTIVFWNLGNGSYPFSVGAVPHYTVNPASGTIVVQGRLAYQNVTFTQVQFSVTFQESGLPSGTSWSVTLNGTQESSTGPTIVFWERNGVYPYTIGAVAYYNVTPSAGSVTVNGGPQTVPISFTQALSPIWFKETGLPAGDSWSVALNGKSTPSTGSTIALLVTGAGPFGYNISVPTGLVADPTAGHATVGQTVSVSIGWPYAVKFTGAAGGWTWSVTVGGLTETTIGAITFSQPNGTFGWSAGSESGTYNGQPCTLSPSTPTGTFTVAGGPAYPVVGYPAPSSSSCNPGPPPPPPCVPVGLFEPMRCIAGHNEPTVPLATAGASPAALGSLLAFVVPGTQRPHGPVVRRRRRAGRP